MEGASGVVMTNAKETTRLQPLHQQYYLVNKGGVTNEIARPNNTVHPYMSSTLVSTIHSDRQRLHSMSEGYIGYPGLRESSPAANFGHPVHDESLPVLIDLPNLFLYAEDLLSTGDVGARHEFQPSFENSCIDQAVQEFSWLRGEKQRLMENFEDLQFQLRDLNELGCLNIDSFWETDYIGHDETAPPPLTSRHGVYHLGHNKRIVARRQFDENQSSRAKSQLDLYNKHWKEIQVRAEEGSTSTSTHARLAIPWPKASSLRTWPYEFEHGGIDAAPETLAWRWAMHAFFVEAFGLRPVFSRDEKNEITFGLESDHGRTETLAKLKALRRQMNLEKVRWHEDKMKAAFGSAASTNEKVKVVWGVVINLRDIIDQELQNSPT